MSDYMTEIELAKIKKTMEEARELGITNWNTDTISYLITTIESQKAEIEQIKREKEVLYGIYSALRKQSGKDIQSLKAITELAVKGLQFYADEENYDLEQEEHYIKVTLDRGDKARTALTEIARLKSEQT